jgi:Ca2+-transporting ATPase
MLPTAERGSADGLSQGEAEELLRREGPNELPASPRRPWYARFAIHIAEPMSLLLLGAAAIEGLWLQEELEAFAIAGIVLINAVIGTVQEGRAQRALEALRSMEPHAATVVRDGTPRRIDVRTIVPSDVVVLEAGGRVPADMRLLDATDLEIDESVLTGESLPVRKTASINAAATDREDEASAATLVTRGTGHGLVTATGAASSLGRLASELGTKPPPTPLQRRLTSLSARLGLAAVAIAGGVFALTLLRTGGEGLREAFLSAVALAVAAVPEGLAAVVTVVLAIGVRDMADRGAILRRLPAVETLGSATVILTDKTGTLTRNELHVDRVLVGDVDAREPAELPPQVAETVLRVLGVGNEATVDPPTGDPLEVALVTWIGADRLRELRGAHPRLATAPFDAERRRTTALVRDGDAGQLLVTGAPETVVHRCGRALAADGETTPVDDERREALLAKAADLAAAGARVIALGVAQADADGTDIAEADDDLTLVALVPLRDPVRPEAAEAVRRATGAGLRVAMVTGDHAGTARSVAARVGIAPADAAVVEGSTLRDEREEIDPSHVAVFARVRPEDKLHLVRRLQEQDEIVAVTGDGVNDAPALRQADIGVAMGRTGSDVAREAADMVITDDDLGTIVEAIGEGRRLFDGIRKVVDYLVAGNLSEITVVIVALFLVPAAGVPLTPLQLLWINLLTDGVPALALGADRGTGRPAPRPTAGLLSLRRLPLLAARAALIAAASLGALIVARTTFDATWDEARTAMFTVLVVAHLMYAFVVRGDPGDGARPRLERPWTARGLVFAVGIGLVLQVAILAVPAMREVFGLAPFPRGLAILVVAGGLGAPAAMLLLGRRRP